MPRQIAKVGDTFWVPIEDDSSVLGQIVEIQKEVLNSITCAFFAVRNTDENCDIEHLFSPISVQFVTKDFFNNGTWSRITNTPVQISNCKLPYREAETDGWIGATVIGSSNIQMFLSAFFGLRAWDEMHDPNYYQKLLLPGVQRHGYA